MTRYIFLALVLGLAPCSAPAHASPAQAQQEQGQITVPPEELKAYEPVRTAATVDEVIAAARAFAAKYPQSAALRQVEIDVYNKIIAMPRDASRLPHMAAFKELFPASERTLELEYALTPLYLEKGDYKEIYRIGEAFLARHPNDVETHYLLLRVAVDALKKGDTTYVATGKTHGARAIELFAGSERPARFRDDAEWQAYKTENYPLAHQSLGLIGLASGDLELGRDQLTKAIAVNPNDPLNYFFLASVHNDEYTRIAQTFNKMADKSSPEAKKTLEEANAKMDEVIAMLAKAVAYAQGTPQEAAIVQQARPMLEESYKHRHDGKLDGLDEMIKAAKGGTR